VKKILTVLFLSLSLFVQVPAQKAAPQPAATPVPSVKLPYVTKVLSNGLEVIVYPDSGVPVVTVEMVVRNGAFTEPPELNGLSHLYEHMFFKTNSALALYRCNLAQSLQRMDYFNGARCPERIPSWKAQVGDVGYLNEYDKAGALRNASAHEEHVNYFYTTTTPNLATMMRSMRDAMLYPSFDENEFRQEVQVVLAELDRQQSEPGYYLQTTMMDKLFYKYPSRKSPGGTRESVSAATTEKMRLIQSRYYVPNNSALVVTGDVQPEKVFAMAEELFSVWKRGEDPFKNFPLVEHPPLTKSEGVFVTQDVDNAIIQIGWHGPSVGKDDASTYAADIFSFIVEQPGSRLQRKLVDSGLAYSVDIHYYTQRNVGPIRFTIVTSPEKAKAALAAAYAEIAAFTDPAYFTNEELANAKTLVEARDLFMREKQSEYAHILSFWWSSTSSEYYRGYYDKMRLIQRPDINRYLTTYIQGKPHVTVALMSSAAQSAAKLTEADLIGPAK
jgi:zinc protease